MLLRSVEPGDAALAVGEHRRTEGFHDHLSEPGAQTGGELHRRRQIIVISTRVGVVDDGGYDRLAERRVGCDTFPAVLLLGLDDELAEREGGVHPDPSRAAAADGG